MLLSHEMGREVTADDVYQKAECLQQHLIEQGVKEADLEYTLLYWLEFLEGEND